MIENDPKFRARVVVLGRERSDAAQRVVASPISARRS